MPHKQAVAAAARRRVRRDRADRRGQHGHRAVDGSADRHQHRLRAASTVAIGSPSIGSSARSCLIGAGGAARRVRCRAWRSARSHRHVINRDAAKARGLARSARPGWRTVVAARRPRPPSASTLHAINASAARHGGGYAAARSRPRRELLATRGRLRHRLCAARDRRCSRRARGGLAHDRRPARC